MKSRVLSIATAAAAAAFLAACATTPTAPVPRPRATPNPPPPPPTPAEEFAWSSVRGPNTLAVVIAYQPSATQQWSCAGLTEALMPETSYSRGRMMALYGSADRALQTVAQVRARSAANPGADYGQFVKTASCDTNNGFSFADLPNGAYFVIARVKQTRPAGATGEMVIMQRVEVNGGQTVRVTLPQGQRTAPPAPPPPPPRTAPRTPRARPR